MRIVWISFFPIDWLPDLPPPLRGLPRQHPASWQRVLWNELKKQPDLDLHIVSVRRHFRTPYEFKRDGTTFHCLKVPGGMRAVSLFWWETILIRRLLQRLQPDLVHAWGAERGAALVASRCGFPYLVTMQGLLEWCLEHVNLAWVIRLEARLERISLRRASVVTVESSFGAGWLRDRYPHLLVLQIEHAPDWPFQRLHRQPATQPLEFLYVAVMSRLKGTDLLLKALDRLRTDLDFRLTIIGARSPELLKRLRAETSPALWERVRLLHDLTADEVSEEMKRATMVLFPTRVDNSPNSVKEAVVAGVPVVASAIGGIVDYVVPGRNGITFEPGNLEGFIKSIRAAVADPILGQGRVDPATLAKMREYLSPRVMGERFLEAYGQARSQTGKR